ncbi:MAG: carboxypeptidase-like regulatory domain-containing protein, partial [Treponema sp.]|nr:carboxypeptidase-like regulatory domain-containing protein [Treponema sp.]
MKTIVNFFVVLPVLSILAGCTAFINEPKTAAAPGMARVSLNTGSNSGARTITGDLVPLADAMQYDNTYTAVFKESGGQVYTFDFTSIDSTRIFDVPAGAYDILVLAGYIPSTSTSKYLLGSGYVQNKELVVGENPVTITLFSIDAAFFLPPSVPSGGNLEGTLQVDLRNPLLTIGAVGGSFEANSFTSTPNGSGAYTLSATAPTSPTNISEDAALTIGFAGANNLPLPSGWCISDNNISANDDYTKRFIKTITVGPYTITGIVTASDTGNPIAGATVELYNNAPALIDSKTTDADG